jgi:small subunit ribosomal protein S9
MADELDEAPRPGEEEQAQEQPAPEVPDAVEESSEPGSDDRQAEPVAESQQAQAIESHDVQASEPPAEVPSEEPLATAGENEVQPIEEPVASEAQASPEDEAEEEEPPAPSREKPAVPGAHLEVDIVPEGVDPLAPEQPVDPYAIDEYAEPQEVEEEAPELDESETLAQPISTAAIDLAAGARYRATGKRKTAVARVIVKPGSGSYTINGRPLEQYFPRVTLQRNIRQPLETVGYEERMDVVARLHGSGVSAQADALRHGISRALLEADPNLRGELKRRGFLTRDSRAKERKKAGLKKARKRPQFSKR